MSDVLVYAVTSRAQAARTLLGAACRATGIGARLELHSSGGLYERLGPRKAPPFPDLVMWFGPYAGRAAGLDGLLQAHQPARLADGAPHDPDWLWTTLDYSPVGTTGSTPLSTLAEVAAAPRIAMADPERSEVGLSILLATLASDAEGGWQWWQQRAQHGLVLTEDDEAAVAAVADGVAAKALTLQDSASPLTGLPVVPHAIGLTASSRNVDAARHVLDWLNGSDAASLLRYSVWQAGSVVWPDVEWGRQQYAAARKRWAASGFAPIFGQ